MAASLLRSRWCQTVASALALALATAFWATATQAQDYPQRPVKLLVPYPPGGATDVIGRVLAQQLTLELGQPVVVENRPGAAGNLGASAVAKEPPDGQTLLMGALTSHAINSVLFTAKAPFHLEQDFEPIALVGRVPLVITVGPTVKSANLAQFIALAQSRPGTLAYASAGNGSPQHLAAELLQRQAGVKLLHVPYKGSGPALNDLMGGQVDVIIDTLPATQAFIKGQRLRALAVTTAQRVAALPEVPTAAQAGLQDFELGSIFGVLAPAGTPRPIVERLSAALGAILSRPAVRDSLSTQGAMPAFMTPEQTRAAIRSEVARWSKLVAQSAITLE